MAGELTRRSVHCLGDIIVGICVEYLLGGLGDFGILVWVGVLLSLADVDLLDLEAQYIHIFV